MTTISKKTQRKLAPHKNWREMSESEHFVQFYEDDEFLLDSLSGFIGTGLDAGDACIVIATKAHRQGLEERLKANGLDLAAAHTGDEYISLDAVETMSKFMVDGSPEPERFTEVVGSMIERAAKGQRHVRIFGEMVALLWAEGNRGAAILLEELWNDLHNSTHPFSLFCSYSMPGFAGDAYGMQFIVYRAHRKNPHLRTSQTLSNFCKSSWKRKGYSVATTGKVVNGWYNTFYNNNHHTRSTLHGDQHQTATTGRT